MKLSALFTVLLVLGMSARPAHAAGNTDGLVSKVRSFGKIGNGPTPALGGSGGGGTPIISACNSPENATVLLAMLCAGGLLAGRKLARVRVQRKSSFPLAA